MSSRVRYLLMSVGLLAFAAVVWFLVLSPIRANIATTNTAIEDQQTQLQLAQSQLAQAETTREEGKQNLARLLELSKMIPKDEQLPSLLLQLQDLADQSGIDFMAITPGNTVPAGRGDYQLVPLALTFSGTYFDVSDFVYRAEQMVSGPGRLLAVKSVDLALNGGTATGGAGSPVLAVTMAVYAFVAGAPASTSPAAGTTGGSTGSTGATTATTAGSAQ